MSRHNSAQSHQNRASTVATQASYLRPCDECGRSYEAGKSWGKFCSDGCRWAAWKNDHIRVRKAKLIEVFGKDALQRLGQA